MILDSDSDSEDDLLGLKFVIIRLKQIFKKNQKMEDASEEVISNVP